MADEISLVRAGGVLPNPRALIPFPDARVVALCLRRRNGVEAAEMANEMLARTPRRSSSIPAQLHSGRRQSRFENFGAQITHNPIPPRLETPYEMSEANNDQIEGQDKPTERYQWTVVSVKQRAEEGRGVGSLGVLHDEIQNGYGVQVESTTRPSLMTRAQTYVRFKLLASRPFSSKKLVGRGDSRI